MPYHWMMVLHHMARQRVEVLEVQVVGSNLVGRASAEVRLVVEWVPVVEEQALVHLEHHSLTLFHRKDLWARDRRKGVDAMVRFVHVLPDEEAGLDHLEPLADGVGA